jgi:hypothetical protein
MRTVARRHRTAALAHTDWCARLHHCNLREHRSEPETYAIVGGNIVVTRVLSQAGERIEMIGVTKEPYGSVVRRLTHWQVAPALLQLPPSGP